MKLISGAVITKCGECENYITRPYYEAGVFLFNQTYCTKTKKIIHRNDIIDPSCPLQDVEVYPNDANLQNLLNMDTLSADFLNSIDHIIIVKNPTTDNKAEKGENK